MSSLSTADGNVTQEGVDQAPKEMQEGHGQISQHVVANGGLGHDENCQLTTPENDAMNAKVQQLVEVLAEGRPFQAVPDPQTGEQHIFAIVANPHHRPEPFRDAKHGRSAGSGRSSSSDWETMDSVSERPDKENEAPGVTVEQRKDGIETCMAQAVRNTRIPHWMAKHLNEQESAVDCPPTASHSKEHSPQNQAPDLIASIGLAPDVVIRASDSGLQYHRISRMPINFHRTYRARTPSIQSNGSELDCSSPLFLKSCEAAIRGSRDLGMLCGEITPVGVKSSVSSSERRRANAKVEAWLEGIDIEAAFGIGAGEGIDNASLRSPPTALTRRPFQVLWELHHCAESSVSPSRIPVPVSRALKDISNLRRPGYLVKNSFAKPEAHQSQKAASGPIRTVESDPVNEGKTGPSSPSKIPVPASTAFEDISSLRPRYLANNSFARLQLAPTKKAVLEPDPTTQTSPYRRARARTNTPDYMAVGTAPPPANIKLRFPRPSTLASRRKWEKVLPSSKRQDITPSMFTFEPSSERREHFEFALGRLEGRVDPPTPSPLQRFAHPLKHYSEHVDTEWMGMTTRHVRPVAKKVAPMNEVVADDTKIIGRCDGADDRVEKGEELQGRAWMGEGINVEAQVEADLGWEEETDSPGLTEDLDFESEEEIAASEHMESVPLMKPAGGLLRRLKARRLIARIKEMVLEQLIEGMD